VVDHSANVHFRKNTVREIIQTEDQRPQSLEAVLFDVNLFFGYSGLVQSTGVFGAMEYEVVASRQLRVAEHARQFLEHLPMPEGPLNPQFE